MANRDKDKYVVIDKIADGLVTLLVGKEEKEVTIELKALPAEAKEGDWFTMDGKGSFSRADDITSERSDLTKNKLDKLRGRQKKDS